MPEVICEKCSTTYILAIQTGTFSIHSKLIEKQSGQPISRPTDIAREKEATRRNLVGVPRELSLSDSENSGLALRTGEVVKFITKSIALLNDDSHYLGVFTLTDQRYAFTQGGNDMSADLSSVDSVYLDNDYIVGLTSSNLGVTSGFYDLLKIANTSGVVDTFAFIPNDKKSTQEVGEALLALKDAREQQASAQEPSPQHTVIIQRDIVKVPCKFCGNLNDLATAKFCSGCGAPVK